MAEFKKVVQVFGEKLFRKVTFQYCASQIVLYKFTFYKSDCTKSEECKVKFEVYELTVRVHLSVRVHFVRVEKGENLTVRVGQSWSKAVCELTVRADCARSTLVNCASWSTMRG